MRSKTAYSVRPTRVRPGVPNRYPWGVWQGLYPSGWICRFRYATREEAEATCDRLNES